MVSIRKAPSLGAWVRGTVVAWTAIIAFSATGATTLSAQVLVDSPWLLGDCNLDDEVDISDVIHGLSYLFLGGEESCAHSCDVDRSGHLDIADPLAVLQLLYGERGAVLPMSRPVEVCDAVDNDCDGEIDEGCRSEDAFAVASLYWSRVELDVDGNPVVVRAYHVFYGTEPGHYTGHEVVRGDLYTTVLHLEPGVTYYFAVAAEAEGGVLGPPSDELPVTGELPWWNDW